MAVLIEGQTFHMPVAPKDRCHMEELGVEVKQVRWWVEDKETGEKTRVTGFDKAGLRTTEPARTAAMRSCGSKFYKDGVWNTVWMKPIASCCACCCAPAGATANWHPWQR